MSDTCGSCDAPIMWARSIGGRAMPLDRDPTPLGNLVLGEGDPPTAVYAAPLRPGKDWRDRLDTVPRYVSHFATCPDAKDHRRG